LTAVIPNVLLTQIGVVNLMGPSLKETGMNSRRALLALCLSAVLAAPSVSLAESQITTISAPPPPRLEIAPPARDGYVWSPGHWEWGGRSYNWVTGTWVVQRRGAHYVGSQWLKDGDQWHFIAGHWER
jgi:hypothetical protein